ncbi:MAG TPA: hypothetical protein VKR06_36500 [Ktedonosporobacter sp.]|nr:hypothetical protein [Ktedonosporobacter sp.]
MEVVVLKLAEPLYEAQSYIYTLCGRPLAFRYEQDGVLLNFLGTHLRSIFPDVLLQHFRYRYEEFLRRCETRGGTSTVVICDDVRSPDANFLSTLGFTLVRVEAPPEVCRMRRALRGDITPGSDQHESEMGLENIRSDHTLINTGTLEQLREHVEILLEELCHDIIGS